MNITIQGEPKEIAALVLALQERQEDFSVEDWSRAVKQSVENTFNHLRDEQRPTLQGAGLSPHQKLQLNNPSSE